MALVENSVPKTHQEALKERLVKSQKLMMGKVEMKLEPGDIDDWFRERARIELRETPEVMEEGFKQLREFLKGK